MSIKRLIVLGGAALLVAGCAADLTSPIKSVSGTAAVRDAKGPKKGGPGTGVTAMSMMSDSSGTCFTPWTISVGLIDSSCGPSEP